MCSVLTDESPSLNLCPVLQCAESLARIQAGLTNTANKRERVKILHKKSESHAVLDQSELISGLFYSSISAYGYF